MYMVCKYVVDMAVSKGRNWETANILLTSSWGEYIFQNKPNISFTHMQFLNFWLTNYIYEHILYKSKIQFYFLCTTLLNLFSSLFLGQKKVHYIFEMPLKNCQSLSEITKPSIVIVLQAFGWQVEQWRWRKTFLNISRNKNKDINNILISKIL